MTVSDAARRLKLSPNRIKELCLAGDLEAEKVQTIVQRGGHRMTVLKWRIDPRSVRRMARRLAQPEPRGK